MKIPGRYSHYVFGVIQSGLTCLVAAGIASVPFLEQGSFLLHWSRSWLIAWATMLPVVMLAAPAIRRLVAGITTP
ncbi:MAG TPA: DUF2798 domain-containing protein [Solimonas sp.]|nr:DUF2798 domain-containing protein [Solimonas sp.]